MEKKQNISRAVIHRIPRYFRYVADLKANGVQRISSRALAETMGLTASQIRQDFNCFGGFGQQGYGYNVEKLHDGLGEILGVNRQRTAILVGVGNIGRALIKNFNFEASGFHLLCAFDADKMVVGMANDCTTIRDVSEMYDYVDQHHPDIAVLTVPYGIAPDIAQGLVEHGVHGIWNFTGEDLHLSGFGIPIENVHFSDSLMTLCYRVNEHTDEQK